ncbi:D-aminoacylase, partial [candidate division KSB1 bacterium]|nr:D-aminoacylase [candidate division KSB1 bacterium]
MKKLCFILILLISGFACTPTADYDIVIRNGMIYDGSGLAPFPGDVAISADTIAAVGSLDQVKGK